MRFPNFSGSAEFGLPEGVDIGRDHNARGLRMKAKNRFLRTLQKGARFARRANALPAPSVVGSLRALTLALLSFAAAWVYAVTPMVSLGGQHALALRTDGTVLSWGGDDSGQLGTGRPPYETRPGLVMGLTAVRSISSGVSHSLAVRDDGAVWTWGNNYDGQLGVGSTVNSPVPVQAQGLTDVTQTCGGGGFSLALKQDGSVWAWGDNYYGTLGDGTESGSLLPKQVPDLNSNVKIACGSSHALALKSDGTVWTWGSNAQGALGDGTTVTRRRPVMVTGLTGVADVAAGEDFSAALMLDGTVREWGASASLTGLNGSARVVPVQAIGVIGAAALVGSVNSSSLVAIGSDGKTWWRWIAGSTPVLQPQVGDLNAVAAGYGQTLLLSSNGTVLSFGENGNTFGNLGDGTTTYRDSPGPVADISHIVQVASGDWHGLALDSWGNVWSWGLDTSGELGQGRALSRAFPGTVPGLSGMVQVAAGHTHSLSLDQSGKVWAWGSNGYGELGDGTYTDSGTPVRLTSISDVQSVAANAFYSIVLTRDGSVWGWGSTLPGVSGDPSIPSVILGNAIAIAAGSEHALALDRDGSVWSWGVNRNGQLGDGTTVDRAQPAKVPGLSGVISIAATNTNSYALKSDGTVVAWGENARGQIGDGSTVNRLAPTPLTGLDNVVEFRAGTQHALARRADGSIWGWHWGYELNGELGTDPTSALSTPAPLTIDIDSIASMAAGDEVSAWVRSDGSVYTGGRNTFGQLGDGTYATREASVAVVDESVNGFLDLDPGTPNMQVPTEKVPAFLVATHLTGGRAATSLYADLKGSAAGEFTGRFAAGYNVYVAAVVPGIAASPYFQLDANRNWSVLTWPMAQFISDATLGNADSVVRAQVMQNFDLSSPSLGGASVLVGYGTDPDEMVRNNRYRTIYTVPSR